MDKKILVVEDDIAFLKMLSTFLERNQFQVFTASSVSAAESILKKESIKTLITDIKLPDDTGMSLLEITRTSYPETDVILMTGYAEVSAAVEAMKKGALDYISKPFRPEELIMILQQAKQQTFTSVELGNKTAASTKTASSKAAENYVVGISEASKKFNQYIQLVGPTNMSVLIEGDSGTGKEVAAKAIHNYSSRASENFIAVDCGAIPKEIAASEFFGHIKGSFTGAVANKIGHFEAADRGTLFLDEVGNLSYENQIQLLRALQEKRIKPVGSNSEIEVDVRIISATNEDLPKAVSEGKFREDLYHRLNEFSIHIPPLASRKEDLFLLSEYFLNEANGLLDKQVAGFSKQVELAFKNYSWPGNLRELRNVIKRAVLLSPTAQIQLDVIPREVLELDAKPRKNFDKEHNEKQLIINALKETDNNKSKAAKLLNITRKTLYNKLEQYDLKL